MSTKREEQDNTMKREHHPPPTRSPPSLNRPPSETPSHISSMRDAWSKAIGGGDVKRKRRHTLKKISKNRILRVADYIINEYGSCLTYSMYKSLVLEKASPEEWDRMRGALRLKFARRVERNCYETNADLLAYHRLIDFNSFADSFNSDNSSSKDDLFRIERRDEILWTFMC